MFFELGPSKAIYPPQKIPLIFDHQLHIQATPPGASYESPELDCDFCHEDIEESESVSDRDIPGHDDCSLCHDVEDVGADECAKCHADIDPAGTSLEAAPMLLPDANLKFAHADHINAGAECADCHPKVPERKLATRDDLPTMDRCVDCHEKAKISVSCDTCHFEDVRGKLVQRFPSGDLKPQRYHAFAIHDESFLRDHSVPAKRERAYCDTCHTQSDCLACHDGIARDVRYHPDAWIAQHSLRARKDDFRCQSCHQVQSFCLSCHIRSGVATAGDLGDLTALRTRRLADPSDVTSVAVGPHPMEADGWLDPSSQNFHGFHAQRNIRACASCHQEQSCIRCHGSGFGRGANPHGPNAARLKGSLAATQNARACLKCHSPFDDSWR